MSARLTGVAVPPVPVPLSATFSVPFAALLLTVRFAKTAPFAVGAKVTLAVHEAPAARELPQVVVSWNGAAVETELIDAAAVPVFLIVTVCAAVVEPTASLPNATEVGVAVNVSVAALVPVPDRATVSVPSVALLLTVSEPEAAPAAVGLKDTVAVHDAPEARVLPQVLDSPNGDPALIELIDADAPPVLVIVTFCPALVEPTVWLPKDTEVGDAVRVAVGGGVLPPEPGKICSSDNCAAVQPLFAVNDNSRYCSFVPEGRLTDTVFPVAGLNV